MDNQQHAICIGRNTYQQSTEQVEGHYTRLLGEDYYRISNYDRMPPFFMSIVSDSDHWLFISSTEGVKTDRGACQ